MPLFSCYKYSIMNEREVQHLATQHLNRAHQHQNEGRFGYALRDYRRSIAVFPSPEAYLSLAAALGYLARYEEAIKECHHAIALDPDLGQPYHDIGTYLIELRRWDQAKVWFELALNAPNYDRRCQAYYNLGRIHEYFGRFVDAMINYRTALKDDPSYKDPKDMIMFLLAKAN